MSFTRVDFPDPLTPVTATSAPSGIRTSMFFRLFSRAPWMTRSPFIPGRLSARRADRPSRRVRYCRVSDSCPLAPAPRPCPCPPFEQLLRRPLEDHPSAVFAGARPEVDDVVGDPDCLFVVLDDDDRVAEVAEMMQRRRAARGCRAGGVRLTARRARRARR